MGNDFEISGRIQFADKIATLCCLIVIYDDGFYVFNIQTERIAEEQY